MDQAPKPARRGWLTPRIMRHARRGGLVLGGAAGLFSFVMVDLARNDAVFSTRIQVYPDTAPEVVVTLSNTATKAMTGADIDFAFYDAAGTRIDVAGTDGTFGAPDSSQFTPRGMTIGPQADKFGELDASNIARPVGEIAQAWVCATFDGSFRVDRVRTEYRLVRDMAGRYGQQEHATTVHFLTTPDCTPPATLAPHRG